MRTVYHISVVASSMRVEILFKTPFLFFFFFNDTPPTEISPLPQPDALPIYPEHRLHDHRRQAERGLIQQQQPRLGHQAPRHRDHLQLTARQRPAERIGKRPDVRKQVEHGVDRKSTRLNSSHLVISYSVFCLT